MTPIEGFKELSWEDAVEGQIVWIAGNLVDNEPTTVYGRHTVHDPKKRTLNSGGIGGTVFYENWRCLYIRK